MTIDNKFTIQKSFVINAGAGSGKTYTLSRRYINALLGFDFFIENNKQKQYFDTLKPAKVEEIITLTYTEAAALEMKERIFSLIKKIINFKDLEESDNDYLSIKTAIDTLNSGKKFNYVIKNLINALHDISSANISTIHSYCLKIIKKHSDIAKVDTGIDLIKDNEKINLIEKVIFDILNKEENKDNVLVLSKYLSIFKINSFVNKYLNDGNFRKNFEAFGDKKDVDYKKILLDISSPKFIDETFNIVIDYLNKNSEKFDEKGLNVSTYTNFLEEYYKNFKNFELKTWSELSKEHGISFQFNKAPFTKLKEIKEDVNYIKLLEKKNEFSVIDLKNEDIFFKTINILKDILAQIKDEYDNRLIGIKKVDYDSIIYITNKIIKKVDTNFKYFMVDEFQDTNDVQYNIIKNSLNNDTNFFVVGDSKQSIYSFQGAEIEVFNNAIKDKKLFSDIVNMDVNFRSDEIVLKNINDIFSKVFIKDENIKLIKQDYEASPQNLKVSSSNKINKGSFNFLITNGDDFPEIPKAEKEAESIAVFIKSIIDGKNDKYKHIKKLIENNKKAIAIVFDAKKNMLLLKKALNKYGIEAKVSATENFYQTKEVNDIFNVLKAINIVSRIKYDTKNQKKLNDFQKFYMVGAYRSNILRIKDKDIKLYLETNKIPEKLIGYYEKSKILTLSELIKFIYDDSRLFDIYANFDNLEQRIANLHKFLNLSLEFETGDNNDLDNFFKIFEESIYFNEVEEEEAFYKASNLESIELCTIHSTKGLSYPMVILAEAQKGLKTQSSREMIKYNQFTLNNNDNKKLVLVGYKIGKYKPLALRLLSSINELKHIAEKKRLLYVALTRAEHDIIISGGLFRNSKGHINKLDDSSYLYMILSSMNIDIEELYNKNIGINIQEYLENFKDLENLKIIKNKVNEIDFKLKKLNFVDKSKISATMNNKIVFDDKKAKIGSLIHKIIEENWKILENTDYVSIFSKYNIENDKDRENIKSSLNKFVESKVYQDIKNSKEVYFELEFETSHISGFIDLVYFDTKKNGWVIIDFKTGNFSEEKNIKYKKQLEFYKDFLESNNKKVVETKLLWL